MKKIICLLLVSTMVFSLCACGSSGTSSINASAEATPAPEYIYKPTFKTFENTNDTYEPSAFTDKGVYAFGYEVVGTNAPEDAFAQNYDQHDIYESRIYYIDYSGNVSKLKNYKPVEIKEAKEGMYDYLGDSNIICMSLSDNGTLLILECIYMSWVDTDEFSSDSDEYYNHYHFTQQYCIRELSEDGAELSRVDIILDNENTYYYASALIQDKDDNILLTKCLDNGSTSIVAIGKDAQEVYEIKTADNAYINDLTKLNDGSVYVQICGDKNELCKLDLDSKEILPGTDVPGDVDSFIVGGGEYSLYYTSGTNFYGYDIETGETAKLFSWLDCDISSDYLWKIGIGDNGTIRVLNSNYDDFKQCNTLELVEINKVPYDPSSQKTELILATNYLDWYIHEEILAFNRKNDKVRIVIKDYSEFNTEDNYSGGITKLNTEIIAGNMPDIIDLSGLPIEEYESKGILENLYPYFDKTYDRSDYLENVFKAAEYDGKLFSTISSFYFKTCVGAKSVVGDGLSWNFKDVNNALKNMNSDEATPFEISATRSSVIEECLSSDMRSYVNESTGEVNFDNNQFTQLLEFASQFPEQYSYEDWSDYDEPSNRISQGRQMLYSETISSTDALINIEASFGKNTPVNFIGYPTQSKSGNSIQPNFGFAMTTSCKDKDAAWEFLQQFFTVKFYESQYSNTGFSPIKSQFEKSLKALETIDYEVEGDNQYKLDENGDRIPIEHEYAVGTGYYTYISINKNLIDAFKEAVLNCDKATETDETVIDTVNEEAQAYFAGQKSANDVAKIVQSKLNIYINEKK